MPAKSASEKYLVVAGVAAAAAAAGLKILSRRRRDTGKGMRTIVLRAQGIEVHTSPFGATITKIIVPDKHGREADVVLGYDNLKGYEDTHERPYFGAIVGRVANRIAKARFTLNDRTYTLAATNGPNTLHGGVKGFDRVWWTATTLPPKPSEGLGEGVRFSYRSEDGEEGFPGNLDATVTYRVAPSKSAEEGVKSKAEGSRLITEMTAVCDAPCPVNLAQHTYFNLRGHDCGASIMDHVIRLHAAEYTPVDDTLIPTGGTARVEGTDFDLFTAPAGVPIGSHPPPGNPGGFDHNYKLRYYKPPTSMNPVSPLGVVAEVYEPITGRRMEVSANVPGVQFYTGNFLSNVSGKNGATYRRHAGFCLETQHFPDAVNQPDFVSCVIEPGETYRHNMVHRFYA